MSATINAPYIDRMLVIARGTPEEKTIPDKELPELEWPIVVLGEPGLGKTRLTHEVGQQTGGRRVTAGSFIRVNPKNFPLDCERPLIIDGLDEVTTSSGSPIHEVLTKLGSLDKCPSKVLLTCRAADWEGAAANQNIFDDFGREPTVVHLQPFADSDVARFLESQVGATKAEAFLQSVEAQELADLLENPQTLELIAMVIADTGDGTLPTTRAGLFEKACPLLLDEKNKLHSRRRFKWTDSQLMDDGGAVFAHLLLSDMAGIALGLRGVGGFIADAELGELSLNAGTYVLKTRLFRSEGENLLGPVHRMIAEYLAARWLAKRLALDMPERLSERRLFQSLSGSSGVPSALRGLNAWLAHHCLSVAQRCIAADPYGVLRYGDVETLAPEQIRGLLAGLDRVSAEDPFFRRDDWRTRACRALARKELKNDILDLLFRRRDNFHLCTLLLEAIRGSELAEEIVPELWGIACSSELAYASRNAALAAILAGPTKDGWDDNIGKLVDSAGENGPRLAVEAILNLTRRGDAVSAQTIAEAIIAHDGLDFPEELPADQVDSVLRLIAERLDAAKADSEWRPGRDLIITAIRLLTSLLSAGASTPAPSLIWQLLQHAERISLPDRATAILSSYFATNLSARHEIQRKVIAESPNQRFGFQRLWRFRIGLELTPVGTVPYLDEIAGKSALNEADRAFWRDLINVHKCDSEIPIEVNEAVQRGLAAHPDLTENLNGKKQEELRRLENEVALERIAHKEKEDQRQLELLADLESRLPEISSGRDLEALHFLAERYLNGILEEWLGVELGKAAKKGFLAQLTLTDLPTVRAIAELRVKGKQFCVEWPLVCGVAEMLSQGLSLNALSSQALRALLAILSHGHPWFSRIWRRDLDNDLEKLVIGTTVDRRSFIVDSIEPFLLAGHDDIPRFLDPASTISTPQLRGELALRWLHDFPLQRRVLEYLLEAALRCAPEPELSQLVREKCGQLNAMEQPVRRLWASAGFISKIPNWEAVVAAEAKADPGLIWVLRKFIMLPDDGGRKRKPGVFELYFIVREFSQAWPLAEMPTGVHGVEEPWDAAKFIEDSIVAIGQDLSTEAGKLLDDLLSRAGTESYRDLIKHERARHQQALCDKTFIKPDFQQVKQMLAGGVPGTIDDLKALTLDHLAKIQEYARGSNTDNWRTYWAGKEPLVEEICRDRLLDDLRNRMGHFGLHMNPESLMPDRKRVDILIQHRGNGLPIEIKGQWNPEVWDAASTQLNDLYTRDWRAQGRGIYLVFWFGHGAAKRLKARPGGLSAPTSSEDFRQMLEETLSDSERSRISVVVLDVSDPAGSATKGGTRKKKTAGRPKNPPSEPGTSGCAN